MKRNTYIAVAAIVVLLCGVAGYFYWQQPRPEPMPVQAPPPPPPPEPIVRRVIEAPPSPPPLPALGESDRLMFDAIAGLIGNKRLMQYFLSERIVRNIVATIDNLPRRNVARTILPVKPVPGKFLVAGTEEAPVISPKNAARYTPYAAIAEAVDAKELVELYVGLYPLFQQAYEELGYPGKYFNDRLLFALDDLLAAPDPGEPVPLVRPRSAYLYADPALEERSIGQRILMRMGTANATKVKAKLRAIRRELALHLREEKVEKN